MIQSDFINTKWDVSNWSKEQKRAWQNRMFSLGYRWSYGRTIGYLNARYYFIQSEGHMTYSSSPQIFVTTDKRTANYSDAFPSSNGYIVWSPSARSNPKVVHDSYVEAAAECERLTLKTKERFHVATLNEPCTVQYYVKWGYDND